MTEFRLTRFAFVLPVVIAGTLILFGVIMGGAAPPEAALAKPASEIAIPF